MFRTSNPALNDETFSAFHAHESSTTMTLEGTAIKSGLLVAVTAFAVTWTWNLTVAANGANAVLWGLGGFVVGTIVAIVTVFKAEWSPVTAPIYAVAEGFVLGVVSGATNMRYPGIAFQAMSLTFATLFALLIAYRVGIIQASENFKLGVVAATGAIVLVYFFSYVLRLFGMQQVMFIHQTGWIGIGFSVVVVIVAALNLVLDFDFIETGVERGAPKFMEWYAAFGLLVTLVWLYIEILSLLRKLADRK